MMVAGPASAREWHAAPGRHGPAQRSPARAGGEWAVVVHEDLLQVDQSVLNIYC